MGANIWWTIECEVSKKENWKRNERCGPFTIRRQAATEPFYDLRISAVHEKWLFKIEFCEAQHRSNRTFHLNNARDVNITHWNSDSASIDEPCWICVWECECVRAMRTNQFLSQMKFHMVEVLLELCNVYVVYAVWGWTMNKSSQTKIILNTWALKRQISLSSSHVFNMISIRELLFVLQPCTAVRGMCWRNVVSE